MTPKLPPHIAEIDFFITERFPPYRWYQIIFEIQILSVVCRIKLIIRVSWRILVFWFWVIWPGHFSFHNILYRECQDGYQFEEGIWLFTTGTPEVNRQDHLHHLILIYFLSSTSFYDFETRFWSDVLLNTMHEQFRYVAFLWGND